MIVSLEVVPRDRETIAASVKTALAFPEISLINVPDLTKFPIRSWDACEIIARVQAERDTARPLSVMPHIRAVDFNLNKPFPRELLSVDRALVIAGDLPLGDQSGGDPHVGMAQKTYQTETPAFIRKIKSEMPGLKIYAAFDPYRSNIHYELDYLKAKEDSGADGFMSQPFFDLRLLEIYAEYLEGKDVFWGVSPVLSASSRNYWESRNRAIFPNSFRPELDWNIEFGRRVLGFCRDRGFNLYLMPIKVDIEAYLTGLFAK